MSVEWSESDREFNGPMQTADLYPVGGVAACDGDFRGEKQSKFLLRDRLGALSVCSLDLLNGL